MPDTPNIPPPSVWLALTEVHRAALDILSLGLSRRTLHRVAKDGDGHPVMVLPGFFGSDEYNGALRRFLTGLGYAVHGWGQGINLGPRGGVTEALQERLDKLHDRYQEPVSLVGHSLGGIFARELARDAPQKVRQVISLGSPFGEGRMTASIPSRLFMALNPPDEIPVDQDLLSDAPPVPTTAIYSHGDGIVNWQTTLQNDGHAHTQSIRVRGSHCAMTFNPAIWYLLSECLALPASSWEPFRRESWRALVYPEATSSA